MAEDKVEKASSEKSEGKPGDEPSDASAKRPDTTPPASGRRPGSTSSVFNTDDTGSFAATSNKPNDKAKPSDKDAATAATERAPGKAESSPAKDAPRSESASGTEKKDAASKATGEASPAKPDTSKPNPKGDDPSGANEVDAAWDAKPAAGASPGEPKPVDAQAKAGETAKQPDTKKDDAKAAGPAASSKVDTKVEPKKKSFGETTQKSIAPTHEEKAKAVKRLESAEARQRPSPAPGKSEDTGRLQTIPPPAGSASAAAAAASKVPPPPGVAARTVPPPERHVPTAAPPGIGRMEEKLNSLGVTLRNYVVISIALLAMFAIALVMEARTGWLHFSAQGQTYGKIYVDQPEVVSRDRLVHDRAVQDEWLRALLGTPTTNPSAVKAAAAATSPEAQSRPAEAEAAPTPSAQGSEAPPAPLPVESPEAPDPVAQFHDQLAFRNEVRAELIDNLLDDDPSPDGNTLYLLKFDSTLVPERRTTAFGVVRADVGNRYGAALDDGRQPLNDEASFDALAKKLLERPEGDLEAIADLYPLFQKSLKAAAERIDGEQARGRRLIQDALRSNLQSDDNAPWLGGVRPDATPAEQWSDAALEQLDLDDLYAFADYLGTAEATREAAAACPEGRDAQVALARIACVIDKLSSGKGRGKRAAREAKLGEFYAAYYVAGAGAKLAESLAPYATLVAKGAGVAVEARTLDSVAASQPTGWLAKGTRYNLASSSTRPVAAAPESETPDDAAGREAASPKAPAATSEQVLSRHVGFLEFVRRVVGSKTHAFTRAVGQRTNSKEELEARGSVGEVLRGAGAQADAAALRATLSDARRKSRLANAVDRNPLVVGFASDLLDPARPDVASFGWLLGPALELSASEADVKFTQRPIHNPLSVVVSVPSWWRSMRVSLDPFWLTRDGECVSVAGKPRGCEVLGSVIEGVQPASDAKQPATADGAVSFDVALPGDERGVEAILLPDAGLEVPTVFRDRLETLTVRAGQPAAIVIPGKHLWKNSTVTLGAQTAEHVAVLPDTSGIIAKFERIRWPGAVDASVQYRGLPLNVWTSQGRAYAGQVIVYPETAPARE